MASNFLFAIGINKYNSPRFPTLKNALEDSNALINTLETKYGFEEHKYLFDDEATRSNIIDALVDLKNLSSEDNLVIFFAGHGDQDPETKQGFMIPIDGNKRSQFVSYSEIKDSISYVKAKHILLIFDCCFSANFISRTRSSIPKHSSIEKISNKPSRYFLGAGGEEKVSDGGNDKNSPFTGSILRLLENNTKKNICASELAIYVRENVGNMKQQQPVFESININGHVVGGEFIFTLKDDFINFSENNKDIKELTDSIPSLSFSFKDSFHIKDIDPLIAIFLQNATRRYKQKIAPIFKIFIEEEENINKKINEIAPYTNNVEELKRIADLKDILSHFYQIKSEIVFCIKSLIEIKVKQGFDYYDFEHFVITVHEILKDLWTTQIIFEQTWIEREIQTKYKKKEPLKYAGHIKLDIFDRKQTFSFPIYENKKEVEELFKKRLSSFNLKDKNSFLQAMMADIEVSDLSPEQITSKVIPAIISKLYHKSIIESIEDIPLNDLKIGIG